MFLSLSKHTPMFSEMSLQDEITSQEHKELIHKIQKQDDEYSALIKQEAKEEALKVSQEQDAERRRKANLRKYL